MDSKEIKNIRKGMGLTQQQFADRLVLSIGAVRDWEQGRTSPGKRSLSDIQNLIFKTFTEKDN